MSNKKKGKSKKTLWEIKLSNKKRRRQKTLLIMAVVFATLVLGSATLVIVLPRRVNKNADKAVGLSLSYKPKYTSFDEYDVMEVELDIKPDEFKDMIENPRKKDLREASVKINNKEYNKIGVRTRGHSTISKNEAMGGYRYNLELRLDAFNKNSNYEGVESINLNFSITYTGLINEYIGYRLMKTMGIISPECCFAFLKVNGVDWGVCVAVEEVDKTFVKKNFENTQGDLYKSVRSGEDHEEALMDYWYSFKQLRLKTNKTTTDHDAFKTMAQSFVDEEGYEKYFDVDTFLKLAALNRVTGNFDDFSTLQNNYYLYETNGYFTVIPWDLDEGFRYASDSEDIMRIYPKESENNREIGFNIFYIILKNDEYKKQYTEYVKKACSIIDEDILKIMINESVHRIDKYCRKDRTMLYPYDKWRDDIFGGECFLYGDIYKTACTLKEQALAQVNGESDGFKIPEEYKEYSEDELSAMFVVPENYSDIFADIAAGAQ